MKRRIAYLVVGSLMLAELLSLSSLNASSDSGSVAFLPWISKWSSYSFFAAGHTYGVPAVNEPGLYPPFRALFPEINARKEELGVFTGDIVVEGTPGNWDAVDLNLAALTPPVHFAVGNHDVTDRDLYASRYGPTYYSYSNQRDLFVVLDGELDHGNITGDQLAFLQETLRSSDALHVFVFVHKLIWVVEGTPYYVLCDYINSPVGYDFHSNFWTDVEPLFRELDVPVYIVAGDVGVPWAMSLFYEHYDNIYLIASGMGGAREENYLVFDVEPGGVQIHIKRLDGQPPDLGHIEAYNLDYYRDRASQ